MMKKNTSQAGVALVEFALVVPLLMLVLIGLIEVGRFTYYSILVANAARAGAAYGAQNDITALNNQGMQDAATKDGQSISQLQAVASQFCRCSDGTTESTIACVPLTTCPSGQHRLIYVQVNTSGTFDALFHYPQLPSQFAVSSSAIMRVVGQ
jgi:Flp pilus assembly protein TadG